VITIDAAGNQTVRLDAATYPWLNTPSGMSFLADGTLFLGLYGRGRSGASTRRRAPRRR
jgi:hypothetical protein